LTDGEIQDCLSFLSFIEERTEIDWKEQYLKLSNMAAMCVKELCIFDYMRSLRKPGEPKRSLSYEALEQEAGELFDQMQVEKGFYFPLSEKETFEFLPKIMNPSFTIAGDMEFMIKTGLTLKAAFYSLAQDGTVKPVVTTWLSMILTTLTDKVADLKYEFFRRDQQRKRNQKNASTTSPKIERIKKHSSYSEVSEIFSKYTGSLEQKNKIDKILSKITGISNEKTLRKYRDILVKDFRSKESKD
jgi:hypothetical protein